MVMANGKPHTSGNCGLDSGPNHHADLPMLRLDTATATWHRKIPTQLTLASIRHGRSAVAMFTESRVPSRVNLVAAGMSDLSRS
jgi:hypothetical protein